MDSMAKLEVQAVHHMSTFKLFLQNVENFDHKMKGVGSH